MLQPLGGVPLVEYVYRRCLCAKIKKTFVATSTDTQDDPLAEFCITKNISVLRGNLNNVLERYITVAESIGSEYLVRVCADTPFVDIGLMLRQLDLLRADGLDYVSPRRSTCASGFFSEAMTKDVLKRLALLADPQDREHVTAYIVNHPQDFLVKNIPCNLNPEFIRNTRLTVDYPADLVFANLIVSGLPDKFLFTSGDILYAARQVIDGKNNL